MVMVVMSLTAVMGCAAFAIDIGRVHNEQVKIQDATDIAALAAVNGFPKYNDTLKYAKEYAEKNCEGLTVAIDYTENGDTVTVNTTKTVPYVFAKVFGLENTTLKASATAQKVASAGDSSAPASKCYKETIVDQHRPPETGRSYHVFHFKSDHNGSWDPNNHRG